MQSRKKERPKAGETTLFTELDSTSTQNIDYSKRPTQKEMRELDELLVARREDREESIDEMAHQNGIFLTSERMQVIEKALLELSDLAAQIDNDVSLVHKEDSLKAGALKIRTLLVNFEAAVETQYPPIQFLPRVLAKITGMMGSRKGWAIRKQILQREIYMKALERYQDICEEYIDPMEALSRKSRRSEIPIETVLIYIVLGSIVLVAIVSKL